MRRRHPPGRPEQIGRGVACRGTVWPGGDAEPIPNGVVVVDAGGRVAMIGPAAAIELPHDLPVLSGAWVGPGIVDAHVHLAFGSPEQEIAGGVVGVRDLGAPPERAREWRTGDSGSPVVCCAGPLLTAPGGYPSKSWGAAGFARYLDSPAQSREVVRNLVREGVDLVKVALEGAGSLPVPGLPVLRAVVDAAHDAGLPVTAHALTVAMVSRALDAGVDELCHMPVELLPPALVGRIATMRTPVVSTISTFVAAGEAASTRANARALVAAGVPLLYGTDLGNYGTRPGVEPRELDELALAGLGAVGALRAATDGAARAHGMRGVTGKLTVGEPAALAVLRHDPLTRSETWRRPVAVIAGAHLVQR